MTFEAARCSRLFAANALEGAKGIALRLFEAFGSRKNALPVVRLCCGDRIGVVVAVVIDDDGG